MTVWDERARTVTDAGSVNIEDVYQRELELEFVTANIGGRVLEVGCGNGYNASIFRDYVEHIDAFDVSADMIARAEVDHPGPNYYQASVLDHLAASRYYDTVVCIRTLINLPDLQAQRLAIQNMLGWLRPGGALVLVEGFSDGFRALSGLRWELGLPPIDPAPINTYSDLSDFDLGPPDFHTGTYDILTRVLLPLFGPALAVGPYHQSLLELARVLGNDHTEKYARVRGWVIER